MSRDLALKTFLHECSLEKGEDLLHFLPEDEQQRIANTPLATIREEKKENHFLEHIHWSWMLPFFKKLSKPEQQIFLRVFHNTARKDLSRALKIVASTDKISPIGIDFLTKQTLHFLNDSSHLPSYYLPPSPLNFLLHLDKKQIEHLINILSLYDLAYELRQIVETKTLQKIYSFLSNDEKKFLKIISGTKEPYPISRIGLDKWDEKEESFRLSLHRRGLCRLGIALSGQNPDLIWYICHQLDSGRGHVLEKSCLPEAHPGASSWMIQRIEELFKPSEI